MRQSLTALAIGTAALTILTPARTAPQRASGVTLRRFTVTPGVVPGDGASVRVNVQLTAPAGKISQVRAIGYVSSSGYGPYVTLAGTNGVYRGECRVPVNHSPATVPATIVLVIQTKDGAQIQRTTTVRVRSWKGGSDLPPPPPTQ